MILGEGVMADIFNPIVTENLTTNGDVSNATESEQQPSSEEEIARILNLVIRPVLILFGTFGNGLSFYIMRQGSLKKMSTCFYLSVLALADTSKCFVLITSHELPASGSEWFKHGFLAFCFERRGELCP